MLLKNFGSAERLTAVMSNLTFDYFVSVNNYSFGNFFFMISSIKNTIFFLHRKNFFSKFSAPS